MHEPQEVEGTAVEEVSETVLEAAEVVSEQRKRTAVWRHPDHRDIEHLIRAGRDATWISYWLQDKYPVPEDQQDAEELGYTEAQANTWRLRAKTIEEYRATWMPEYDPRVDVVNEELQDLIGRHLPARDGQLAELDVMEMGLRVTQHNVAQAIKSDTKLKMVTPTTLEATNQMVSTAEKLARLKAQLQVPGYRLAPERQEIRTDNTTRQQTQLSARVSLEGAENADGTRVPAEQQKVKAVLGLLEMPAEERKALLAAAHTEPEPESESGGGTDA